jgi:hypothetical protein
MKTCVISINKSKRLRLEEHVARMGVMGIYNIIPSIDFPCPMTQYSLGSNSYHAPVLTN